MPKYTVMIKQECWHTMVIETDLTDVTDIENYVYDMEGEEEKAAITDTENYIWQVETVEPYCEEEPTKY